jgi:hypothetical protein
MSLFRESGAEKHTTLLFGAGASTTSGLPGWDELTVRLLVNSGAVSDAASAKLLLDRQDPLIVVEAARAKYGQNWEQKVRNALYAGVVSVESSPLHLAAVSHVLGGEQADTSLVTLNFDVLLENALNEETGEPVSSVSDSAQKPDGLAVHHLHGVVSPQTAENVVLTLTDFLEVITAEDSWQLEYLRAALDRGAVIIAGTSYRDPDVRQWLHAARKNAPEGHAVIVLLARQGFELSKDEFHSLQVAIQEQWHAVGLRAVLLNDHSDAAQVIRELRFVNEPDYIAPQARAQAIWEHHQANFDLLQSKYVDVLRHDSARMKSVLDVDELNMTVWLSDGRGRLVRWAAEDRIYLDPTALRSVESGYDSFWIAGRALGTDTLLIQDIEERGTRRWQSVLAVPVFAPHPELPTMSAGVLTIGLPGRATEYEGSKLIWVDLITEIADTWSTRITEDVFVRGGGTI